MAHPQERELREAFEVFFGEGIREGRFLAVHEPESERQIDFAYRFVPDGDDDDEIDEEALDSAFESLRQAREERQAAGLPEPEPVPYVDDSEQEAFVTFGWPAAGAKEKKLAKRLGVTPPRSRKVSATNPFTREPMGERTVITAAERVLTGPEEALEICLILLRVLYDIPDDRWLWITDLYENDEWPVPLPRPDVWPPATTGGESA